MVHRTNGSHALHRTNIQVGARGDIIVAAVWLHLHTVDIGFGSFAVLIVLYPPFCDLALSAVANTVA